LLQARFKGLLWVLHDAMTKTGTADAKRLKISYFSKLTLKPTVRLKTDVNLHTLMISHFSLKTYREATQ
jgi:hypothetical protein